MTQYGTADFDVQDFNNREAADKTVFCHFYIKPKENEAKSIEAGRPIFEDREYVKIRTPGNQTNEIDRPVTDMDRKRFSAAYKAFKEGDSEQLIGTPLVEAPWITRSQVEELSYLRIRTIEQLAAVGDDVCTRISGLFKLKQRAQQMAAKAEHDAPFIKIQAERDQMKSEMAAMKEAMAEQAAIIADLKKANLPQAEKKG